MYETNRSQTHGACTLVHPGVRDKSISDTRRLSRTPGCTRQIDLRHTALVHSYTRVYKTNQSQTPGACLIHPGVQDKSISDTRRLSRTPGCTRQIDLRHTALVSYTRVYETNRSQTPGACLVHPGVRDKSISDTRCLSRTPGCMRQIDLRHPGLVSYIRVYETIDLRHPALVSYTRVYETIDLRHPALVSYTRVYETSVSDVIMTSQWHTNIDITKAYKY